MADSKPRIPGLDPDNCTPEQAELMGPWSKMNWVNVLANDPGLYRVYQPLIEKIVAKSSLPVRDRQLLCLRTLTLGNDVYEVTHHELISKSAGLSDAEIAAMRAGEGPELSAFDKVLVSAAEKLVASQHIDDATWNALAERYSKVQLMELVILVGTYLTMAMVTRNYEIPLEDDETFQGFAQQREYT